MRVTFSIDAEENTIFIPGAVRTDKYIRFSWPGRSVQAKVVECYSDEKTICMTLDVPGLEIPRL